MRGIPSLTRLGAFLVPLFLFGAESRPARAPATPAPDLIAVGRVESTQGVIGPEGGTLVSPDGTVEVTWDPNPKRGPTPSKVWTLVAGGGGGLSFQINGAAGPATVSCWPPGERSPGTSGTSGPGPDPVKAPEPVIEIEEGNGEWREVEAPRQANGAHKVRIDDDLAPIDTRGAVRRLFMVVPREAIMRLGDKKTFTLRPNAPPPPLPPESDPSSDDYLPPIAPTPPPGGDSSADDYLAPLATKKAASGSSAKAAPKASSSSAVDRAIDQKLGDALRRTQQKKAGVERWRVYNVPWGNATLGTISSGLRGLPEHALTESVEYTAPKAMPEVIRREDKIVRIAVDVRRGKTVEAYSVPVRLLDEGEVAVEFSCTLVHRHKSNRSATKNSVKVDDAEDFSETFVVEGAFVLQMSESKANRSLWVHQEKREPVKLSYRATLNRTKIHDEKGDGEYGERGDTVTESAESSGTGDWPAPFFTYYRQEKKWEARIPVSQWLQEGLLRSSESTHQTLRPSGDPVHLPGLTRGWAIQSLPFDLPQFSTRSTEAEREWTGEIERHGDGFRYHVKWSVRR